MDTWDSHRRESSRVLGLTRRYGACWGPGQQGRDDGNGGDVAACGARGPHLLYLLPHHRRQETR
eukprot:1164113-Rhodomonas_salina.3